MTDDITTTENVFEAKAWKMAGIIYRTILPAVASEQEFTAKLGLYLAIALKAEREEEREKCAKIVDDNADQYTGLLAKQADKPQDFATYAGDLTIASLHGACSRIAAAIRNRSS